MKNLCILIGNVGKDPEIRRFDNSIKASFSLATSKTFTKDGEKITHTEWHNIIVWGKLAEIVEKYVKKGQLISVDGEINYRSYDDKDGNKKYITEINVGSLQMLGGKKSEQSETHTSPDDFGSEFPG